MRDTGTSEYLDIRGLRHHVRHWGPRDAPTFFLLHGWMDSSPTFQFLVEALEQPWHIIAPDWRGYGASEWLDRPYWFPDYYADLDVLLDHFSPDCPATLVGHSMGANIAATYAAVRPQRVARLAMLDFLGLRPPPEVDAPMQLVQWMDAVAARPQVRPYADAAALARRLRMVNPRLTPEQADFLSRAVSRPRPDGQIEMACDPWHRVHGPSLYHIEDSLAAWRKIQAPVLLLIADKGFVDDRMGDDPAEFERRIDCFPQRQVVTITDSGHNVQHDQPVQVARALEAFLTG